VISAADAVTGDDLAAQQLINTDVQLADQLSSVSSDNPR
jgi:hypothetical protein